MVVKGPGRADDDVAAFHRIGFVLADEDRVFGRFADEPGLAAQVAMGLGALAGHQNLRVHPDGKIFRFEADHRAHAGHAIRADGDDLTGTFEAAINTVPFPMGRSLAFARGHALVALESGADQMMLAEKTFEVFVGGADVGHRSFSKPGAKSPG